MKRELIEAYYEAHFREIQNSVKTSEIIEKDNKLRRLDQEICESKQEEDCGVWKKYDDIMSLTNSVEDDMFKELYIRGFQDYERLVLGYNKKSVDYDQDDLISRKEILEALKDIFEKYQMSFGGEYGGFGAAVQEAVEALLIPSRKNESKKLD